MQFLMIVSVILYLYVYKVVKSRYKKGIININFPQSGPALQGCTVNVP